MTDIGIFLIHSVAGRSDDVIKIKPILDVFRISYRSTHQNVHHFVYCDFAQTCRYVDDLIDLLSIDTDPYESIQFNFPCFPSVMFRIDDVYDLALRRSISDRLKSTLMNWPEAALPLFALPRSALTLATAPAPAPAPATEMQTETPATAAP
jgi:hypothetical protein